MMNEKRILQAYYTKSRPIVDYMVELLDLSGDEKIFEPCAGDGVFIDAVLDKFPNVEIDAFEINPKAVQELELKFSEQQNIDIKQTDTLTDVDLQFNSLNGGFYDAVIANPPYGAWRDKEERKKLKKSFNGFYAKESYSLFLYKSIEALKDGGKLVFIIPDTYLNLNMHKDIRKYILSVTKIKEIALFPSSFFPGVNFGYANLSIIALEKCGDFEECLNNSFKTIQGFKTVEELGIREARHITPINTKQKEVFSNKGHVFFSNINTEIISCIRNSERFIGDICDCATGFYSGNDKSYLRVLNKEVRNSQKYNTVDKDKVTYDCSQRPLDGIGNDRIFVPIVKGGNIRYFKPDNWFMEWSREVVSFYKKDKKARYQNSSFYFKKGIAVPMVSSSSITGALIENRLFDQSIVGVFPKDEELVPYLLAFFNSPTCNQLIRTINPSTNNSSNYIKKIPFKTPSSVYREQVEKNIQKIIEQISLTGNYEQTLEEENNDIIKEIYNF